MPIGEVGGAFADGNFAAPGPTITYTSAEHNTLILSGTVYTGTTVITGITSIADSAGNHWTYSTSNLQSPPSHVNSSGGNYYCAFIAWCIGAAPITQVTVTDGTGATNFWEVVLTEWTGIGAPGAGGAAGGTAINPATPNIVRYHPDDLVFGVIYSIAGLTGAAPAGATELVGGFFNNVASISGTVGPYGFTWPSSGTADYAAAIMPFSAVPAAPSAALLTGISAALHVKYDYLATDLITGRVLADTLPLTVQTFSAQLNGSGTLTGSLPFTGSASSGWAVNAGFVQALEARRAVLWVMQDGYPVWNGVVWDWPHTTLSGGNLPVSAQTMDSVWSKRLITATLEYRNVDIYTMFQDLVSYGMTKLSAFTSTLSPTPAPPPLVQQAAAVAGIVLPGPLLAGTSWSASYLYSDLRKVSDAWSDLTSAANLEYWFQPGLDQSGSMVTYVRLGTLGTSAASSTIQLTYPGNVIDYGYQRTGSQGANYIWATAPPNGSAESWLSQYPAGADNRDLTAGYPLMEDTVSWNGSTVTTQSQIDGYAIGTVALRTQAMTEPVVTVGGGQFPQAKDIFLGDTCQLIATSPLHPATSSGQPGLQVTVRISGWTVTPPNANQPESIQITTSGILQP